MATPDTTPEPCWLTDPDLGDPDAGYVVFDQDGAGAVSCRPSSAARGRAPFPAPAWSNGACGFPAHRSPDLVGLVGTTRETLNKWLGSYQDEGQIWLEKDRITILQTEALRHQIA